MKEGNLLDGFKNLLSQPLKQHAPQLLGHPASRLASGVDKLLPNLFSAILHRGTESPEGAQALCALLNAPVVDTGLLDQDPNTVLGGGMPTDSLLRGGRSQLTQLFGAQLPRLYDTAIKSTGLGAAHGGTLAATVTPFALALIKRALASQSGRISASQLATLLDSHNRIVVLPGLRENAGAAARQAVPVAKAA